MENNREILEALFENEKIDLQRGDLFDTSPVPMPEDFDFGRVEGMMLGLAIGDSLGRPTEGMLPENRRARLGEIRDYLPSSYADGLIGVPSDDTQLAFWTLEQMINELTFLPGNVAKRFCHDRIFGIGSPYPGIHLLVSHRDHRGAETIQHTVHSPRGQGKGI